MVFILGANFVCWRQDIKCGSKMALKYPAPQVRGTSLHRVHLSPILRWSTGGEGPNIRAHPVRSGPQVGWTRSEGWTVGWTRSEGCTEEGHFVSSPHK